MGVLMAPMMLWMLHSALTGQSGVSAMAGLAFIGAHVLVLIVAIGAVLMATRMSPKWRARAARLHRPSASHFGAMVMGLIVSGAFIHVILHGVIG